MSQLTDDQLLERFAQTRDAEAFGCLVGRHMGLVHATCRRETGDDALAEDAAQAVFLLLARKARALRAERSLASWLFAASRLTARNLLRAERRRKAREERASLETERTMNPQDPGPIEPMLNEALARLRPDDRQAVILRYLEGRSLAEVAAELNLAENAARVRVQRAVERLRLSLGRMGVAVTVVALVAALDRQASAAVPARLLAVSAPPAASSGVGPGAWKPLAKGTSLVLATTTTTKALLASGVALVAAGGFVAAQARTVIDPSTVRAAFRPITGVWRGMVRPNPRMAPSPLELTIAPEGDTGASVTIHFLEQHQAERHHIKIDPHTGHAFMTNSGEPKRQELEATGLAQVAATGRGEISFFGKNTDGKDDQRITFVPQGDRLTMRMEHLNERGSVQKDETVLERAK